jgi:hypothetical protein
MTPGSEPMSPSKGAQGIAEAARAAERHVPEGLVATTLWDISPAEHLTQIEEISKGAAERMGAGWAEGLGTSYATDLARGLGVAGLAPDISKRMQESLGIAGSFKSPALDMAGLAGAGLASQRLAKQLSDITGAAGFAKQWAGAHPTGLFAGENFKALTAVQEMMAETKRMEAVLDLGKTTIPGVQDLVSGGLVAGLDQQLLRSPLAAKGLFPADHLASVFGASSTLATAKLFETAIAPFSKQIAALGSLTTPNVLAGITVPNPLAGLTIPNPLVVEHGREIDAAIERVAKMWEASALWFLLSILSVGQLVAIARMERADVEAVLLDALEIVVTTGTFTAALIAIVKKAPSYVTDDQRDDMLHGLEHAQEGEFSRAAGPLTAGLEGAIWSAGRELEVIDGDRRLLDKPEQGRIHRVERVVRKLPAAQEFRSFVCGRVFGDLGNPLRHGEQSDRRQRSLFAIVAIAGWVEAFMKVPAADALGTLLSDELA